MKCPNCGQEIQAGHLYCEKCGMEIRIVPDFEPEIENSITETLSTVAEEIEVNNSKSEDRSNAADTEKKKSGKNSSQDEFFKEEPDKNRIILGVITFVFIVLIAVGIGSLMYFNYSVPYQIKKAREYAELGKYQEAIKYLDKAIRLDSDNNETIFLQANYYYLTGEPEKAVEILLSLIEKEYLTYEDAERAYENIISIYDEQERYEDINELLLNCSNEEIVTLFQRYLALPPEFSYVGGSYDEVIPLKLSANTTGKIYYTLNGSTPTRYSQVYTAPIFLESGKYQVSALFINDYGIESKVVKNWYEINLTVPDPPQVLQYSGRYVVPTRIEVICPETETVYYTTDGTEPNTDSLQYSGPIEMPLGRSNFKFTVISEEGVRSETISRSYEFRMETDVSVDDAIFNVVKALMKRNVLIDVQGHAQGVTGKYIFKYDSIVELNETYYYILSEFYEDTNGSQTKADRMYAVEVYTGSPNRLIYDEQGQMGLISLED